MIRSGVDLIEIARIGESVDRFGQRFLERVYTPDELAGCGGRVESLAARFAAKEAAAKMLGTGIWRHDIGWTDIEVVRDPVSGAPSSMSGRTRSVVRSDCSRRHLAIRP